MHLHRIAACALFLISMFLVHSSSALIIPERHGSQTCQDYVIISTRGTGELQGPSEGFVGMISKTLGTISGGFEYDTVYPAAWNAISSSYGTEDILNYLDHGSKNCPDQKYVLLGYSQGATSTVDALKQISATSATGKAIKAVILIGDPEHMPGKKSNVDQLGGHTTDFMYGLAAFLIPSPGIPDSWDVTGKVLDICYYGDGVCMGEEITPPHLLYGTDPGVQAIGADFLISELQ